MFGVEVDCSSVTLNLGKIPNKLLAKDECLFKILLAAVREMPAGKPPLKDNQTTTISDMTP